MVVIVAGFYFYARYRVHKAIGELPQKLGVEIQQSTEGFSLSKSEGGRTLFTIKASKAVQYKQGGRASLKDVNIVVYGKDSKRFDQIYGAEFDYDPQAGTVAANGEVHIDLQGNAEGSVRPEQGPPQELKNPVHLKTSGLVFNQKTGIAHTDHELEFRVPQASGTAKGATYDSNANELTLEADVLLTTSGPRVTEIRAAKGVITKDPQPQIALNSVKIAQEQTSIDARAVSIFIRQDTNTIDHITATGDVTMRRSGPDALYVMAPRADIVTGEKNVVRSAVLTGGVQFKVSGDQNGEVTAGRLDLDFGGKSRLQSVRASENVVMRQLPSAESKQTVEIASAGMIAKARNGRAITSAETAGAGRVTFVQANSKPGEKTTITADSFRAQFSSLGKLDVIRGDGNAKIVASAPDQPDKVSTSKSLVAEFAPGGGISSIVQDGGFEYFEAAGKNTNERRATALRAKYTPDDETLTLSGNPRLVDGGMTITAQSIRVDRQRGDAFAQGAVKTTYSDLRPDPSGAMLARSEPVHVTAKNMNVQRLSGIARYTGGARLWQGANIVEAPTIEFNRTERTLTAQGTQGQAVSSVFVQVDRAGKATPGVVTAGKLTYTDRDRRARYSGGVTAKSSEMTITADHVDILLRASGEQKPGFTGPSQLQQIIAEQKVVIQDPSRRATGNRLVYTPTNGEFVLTGGPPTVTDVQYGTVRGDSLTFYSHDDRVVVESAGSSRTVTRTRIRQ